MSFLHPLALGFAALLVVIVALHLYDRRRRTVVVPSLLLWEDVPPAAPPVRVPRSSLLMALQLAAVAALVLGLAGPYSPRLAGRERSAVFVLDVSASMGAREADGRSRFERARAALRRRIGTLAPGRKGALILAGSRPVVALPWTGDRGALRAAVDAARPREEPGALPAAVVLARGMAAAAEDPARVEVFTDGAEAVDPRLAAGVRIHAFGRTGDNLAIVGFTAGGSRIGGGRASPVVRVENFSRQPAHAVLRLEGDGEPLGRIGFSLPARGGRTVAFPAAAAHVLHAVLEADDALGADDEAFAMAGRMTPIRLLAVTSSPRLRMALRRMDELTEGLKVRVAEGEGAGGAVADVALLHRTAEDVPGAGLLYVFPPPGAAPCRAEEQSAPAVLLTWDDRHPVLRGLALAPRRPFSPLRVPGAGAWATTLVEGRAPGTDVPLLVAGWHGGRRTACLAFDLARRDLFSSEEAGITLLLLRLIEWLAPPERDPVRIVPTGSFVPLAGLSARPVEVTDPAGQPVAGAGGDGPGLTPHRVGRYTVRSDGARREVFAHLLDAAESDIGPKQPDTAPQGVSAEEEGERPPASSPWRQALVLTALLCVALEWVLYRRALREPAHG